MDDLFHENRSSKSDVSYVSRSRVDISISYSDNCRSRWIEKEKSPTKYNCERKGNDRRIRSSALFFSGGYY